MTRILFRCDSSLLIGSGHVIRCRTLARELQRRGAEVLFLCRRQAGDLIALLEREFLVLALPEQPLARCEGMKDRELYSAWLGCTQIKDAVDCLAALASVGLRSAEWMVVDHYGLDAIWQFELLNALAGEAPTRLLAIDDLADRTHQADLLLDQNWFGSVTEQRYQELVSTDCRQLLGPHYALLEPEYSKFHPLVPLRSELRRVLLFFGGVDPDNLTSAALEALMDPALAHLAVDVVLGRQSPHRQAVQDLVAHRPFTTLHEPLPSLAGLIARADLAIGACGTTTWERACLGLPSLVVAITANQSPVAEALDYAGHLQLLGDASPLLAEKVRSALLDRIADKVQLDGGYHLTDGFGAVRLALAMLGPQDEIHLRSVQEGDEALLLRWANDPQVRARSFTSDQIAPYDHRRWFRSTLADPDRLLLIATTADGCPIGQIRFERQPPDPESAAREATVGLSLDRCARGYGLAVDLVLRGLRVIEQYWGPQTEVVAEVLNTNAASNACFSRAGFCLESISSFAPLSRPVSRWRRRAVLSPS